MNTHCYTHTVVVRPRDFKADIPSFEYGSTARIRNCGAQPIHARQAAITAGIFPQLAGLSMLACRVRLGREKMVSSR